MPNDQTPGQRNVASSLAGAIGRVTSILAIPYGYTVTLGAAALLSVARLGVARLREEGTGSRWHIIMAGNMLVVVPMIVTFLLAQQHIIRAFTFTSPK